MHLKTNKKDLDEAKTLKVSLPTKLHLQLHQLKILSGQTISETVEGALEEYFAGLQSAKDPNESETAAAAEGAA